ncbi:hypothetical protein B0H13DRAFT_2308488 [Mycena leptocephala]|nr:hypothetical protein B0H13DRAFT_2308488 [Mycena leptocephala]
MPLSQRSATASASLVMVAVDAYGVCSSTYSVIPSGSGSGFIINVPRARHIRIHIPSAYSNVPSGSGSSSSLPHSQCRAAGKRTPRPCVFSLPHSRLRLRLGLYQPPRRVHHRAASLVQKVRWHINSRRAFTLPAPAQRARERLGLFPECKGIAGGANALRTRDAEECSSSAAGSSDGRMLDLHPPSSTSTHRSRRSLEYDDTGSPNTVRAAQAGSVLGCRTLRFSSARPPGRLSPACRRGRHRGDNLLLPATSKLQALTSDHRGVAVLVHPPPCALFREPSGMKAGKGEAIIRGRTQTGAGVLYHFDVDRGYGAAPGSVSPTGYEKAATRSRTARRATATRAISAR